MSVQVQGIKIDPVTQAEAVSQIEQWLGQKTPRMVVTPNIEFIIAAQEDIEFKKILNQADLSIPDSARLGWLYRLQSIHQPLQRLVVWLFFPFSGRLIDRNFPITTGIDLMNELIRVSAEKGYKIGLLGGLSQQAEIAKKRLIKKYPTLQIDFAESGGRVDKNGQSEHPISLPKLDLLFVGLGHGKQEKWISRQLGQQPVKVMLGVGGSIDYFSGAVSRAPRWMQSFGLEWLYRLVIQPWRVKRQFKILVFVIKLLFSKR